MSKKSKKDKLKKETEHLSLIQKDAQKIQSQYMSELDTNDKYALIVDPTNKYNMSSSQKKFIEYYVNFKNINTAAELAEIDQDVANQFFVAYSTQQEIRRINLALYHRQFANKLLDLDEIGGYLTSLLTGENVPIADQPRGISEKLAIVKLLIDLNKLKIESVQNPSLIMAQDIDIQIKNLSLATIKQLLAQDESHKTYVVDDKLSPEESAYLSTLPTNELLRLIDETNKGENI